MTERDEILGRIAASSGGRSPGSGYVLARPVSATFEEFSLAAVANGAEVVTLADLTQFAGRAVWDADVPAAVTKPLGDQVVDPWAATLGVSACDCAVTETGSVLINARSGRSRLVSLAPPVHAVLVDPSKLVATLGEGIGRLDEGSAVLVSGPSRTADIEGVLVRGVHGPKRLLIVPMPLD